MVTGGLQFRNINMYILTHFVASLVVCTHIIAHIPTPPSHQSNSRYYAFRKYAATRLKTNFSVYWNIPSQRCSVNYGINVNVSKYGILSNIHDGWAGEHITIFPHPGLYPRVDNGSAIYGAIPQCCNLERHIARLRHDVNIRIPYKNFEGLAVIDYEAWQPLWSLNFDTRRIYQNLSTELVKDMHPEWPIEKIITEARKQFEQSAKMFLQVTMRTAISSFPNGRWGFYHYPYCFNGAACNNMQRDCPQFAKKANDRLLWLFQSQRTLYPLAYLHSSINSTCNQIFVDATLREAKRIQETLFVMGSDVPVYLYNTILYKENGKFYTVIDLKNTVAKAFKDGLSGVVLWGNHNLSKDKTACNQLKGYVDAILGPFVLKLLHYEELLPWETL